MSCIVVRRDLTRMNAAMMDDDGTLLGQVVTAMVQRERVTISHVMRYSGLARNTIELLRAGRTPEPHRSTLRRLALGLAVDPSTGELDSQKEREIERLLDVAAGYAEPTSRECRTLVELGLYYRLGSLEKARAWQRVIDTRATWSTEQVRALAADADADA